MRDKAVGAVFGACGGCFATYIGLRTLKQQSASSNAEPPSPSTVAKRYFCPYGLPSDEHVVVHQGFASSVSYRLRIPNWVAEHYSRTDKDGEAVDRKHSRFVADSTVPTLFRATNEDYRGSNLSRGHLAPAGAHKQSQEALNETFLLSANILPQELSNNGSDWLRLERWCRALVAADSPTPWTDVYVVSGPLFLPAGRETIATHSQSATSESPAASKSAPSAVRPPPQRSRVSYDVIGPHEVAVPSHLFKVVLAEDRSEGGEPLERRRALSAFVLPNGPVHDHPDLDEFAASLAEIESASGLTIFADLGEARYHTPPLCGAGAASRCGAGAPIDGRIQGWKLLGHLKLATDCRSLDKAWNDIEGRQSKIDTMPLMRKTREHQAASLACPLPHPDGKHGPAATSTGG